MVGLKKIVMTDAGDGEVEKKAKQTNHRLTVKLKGTAVS